MEATTREELINEVITVLEDFGYEVLTTSDFILVVGHLKERHRNVIRSILGGYLHEFFYTYASNKEKDGFDIQHEGINIFKENKGLDPDDPRYNKLLEKIYSIDPNIYTIRSQETDVFVNLDHYFARIVVDYDDVKDILGKQVNKI